MTEGLRRVSCCGALLCSLFSGPSKTCHAPRALPDLLLWHVRALVLTAERLLQALR